ncbi:hypothetical protein BV898_18692 [Hypsibius exemplaris]|uniref:Uncharacterized protein n=1 Tax=Hypsibius exemplaris TaxID=2072580 RepID=A0A9X6NJU5_HYPEX|nr:hypothetical protein BV898_18692 [Hypsibius exemplaris]
MYSPIVAVFLLSAGLAYAGPYDAPVPAPYSRYGAAPDTWSLYGSPPANQYYSYQTPPSYQSPPNYQPPTPAPTNEGSNGGYQSRPSYPSWQRTAVSQPFCDYGPWLRFCQG